MYIFSSICMTLFTLSNWMQTANVATPTIKENTKPEIRNSTHILFKDRKASLHFHDKDKSHTFRLDNIDYIKVPSLWKKSFNN